MEKVGLILTKYNQHEPDREKNEYSEASALMSGFREIVNFVKANGRLPEKGKSISERQLASRLKSIVENYEKRNYLVTHDEAGIIEMYCVATGFVPDLEGGTALFSSPSTSSEKCESSEQEETTKPKEAVIPGVLKGIAGSSAFARIMGAEQKEKALFGGRFANKPKKEQVMPDYVATRKNCADFENFRPFFNQCLADLRSGIRKAIPFKNEQHIEEGKFYVLGGLLCYVADKGKPYKHKGKTNTRLRLIFVNERESDMLLRSLSTELYKGGLMITETESELFPDQKIAPEDHVTGWIYVLRSRSTSPQVQSIPNLHKIGFTAGSVEDRIAGAEKHVTYLCAPVEIAAKAKVVNIPSHGLEQLIHAVFAKARLDIEVTDPEGQIKRATEWFSAPWEAIDHALQLIALDQISYYEYEPQTKLMSFRKAYDQES